MKNIITLAAAAAACGKTPARIRQVCQAHGLGEKITERCRVLNSRDMNKLRRLMATMKPGPKKKTRKHA